MKIGFIGAGVVAQTISKHVLAVGPRVLLSNTRGPDSLAPLVKKLGSGAEAGTPQQATEQDIVVLAANWPNVQQALFSIPDWKGRILVDTTNRLAGFTPLTLGDISGRTSSEIVADLAPGARVVKAFNSVPMAWISDFSSSKPRTVLFISGDDADAKKPVHNLIEEIGFESVDLGSLAVGGRLQQLGGPPAGIRLTFLVLAMKALVYERAHSLEDFAIKLAEISEPTLRELDVLVEVHAVGINPGETFIRRTRSAEPGGRVLLGWEFAGVVVAARSGVRGFKVGDRVFGTGDMTRDGAWAERVAVDHRIIAKIPENLAFVDAASLPIGALTAWEAMFREQSDLPAGVERVLIVGGAGGVGSVATQLLKAETSALVISTASRPESREWCHEMGADLVIDHSKDIQEQLSAEHIERVDMILSTAKTADNLPWIAKLLRPFGHLSVIDTHLLSVQMYRL